MGCHGNTGIVTTWHFVERYGGITCGVIASAASAAGHLEELVVRQHLDALVAPSGLGRDYGGARRHVDPRCQRLRGKHHFQDP